MKKSIFPLATLLLSSLVFFSACKKDEDGMPTSTEANITSFSFESLNPVVNAAISGTNITAEVPFGTDVTSLAPTIKVSAGARISPASGLPRDFSTTVSYTVTAQDGSTTKDYSVTVSVLDPEDAVISAFEIPEATSVDIDQAAKTILVRVYDGTDVSALVPTVTTIPASATLEPASGVAQDFSSPVTYQVSFGNISSTYAVTVEFIRVGMDIDNATVQFAGNVLSATLPNELSSMGDNERGASMNATHVYVASKSANDIFFYNVDGSSVAAGILKKTDANGNTIVNGGIFGLSDVVATENGILASNMNWNGGEFRVYRWADNDADAELFLNIPALDPADGSSTIRFGDQINFVGDPYGNGRLILMAFPGFNSVASNTRVFWWQVSGGQIQSTTPNIIQLKDLVKAGNYATADIIDIGGEDFLLVNGAEMTPSIFDLDGNRLTNISTDAIPARTISARIFEFNNATYLATALPGSEGSNIKDAGLALYNLSGDDLIEVMNSITLENVEDRLEGTWPMGQNVNGNVAGDVSVVVGTNDVTLMAFATNNGFIVVNAPINN
ncbi:MAG: hypothetical protein RLY31_2877 [Bacteroidota bacterium]